MQRGYNSNYINDFASEEEIRLIYRFFESEPTSGLKCERGCIQNYINEFKIEAYPAAALTPLPSRVHMR